jgi:hypothetical protein
MRRLLYTTLLATSVVLAQDPVVLRGPAYAPNRVAVTNPGGFLETVTGDPGDYVRVDGTSGPCASCADIFVDGEQLTGALDGANSVFGITATPTPPSSLLLFRNGLLQKAGSDYTVSGQVVTFSQGAIPQAGDTLLAYYRASEATSRGAIKPLVGSVGKTPRVSAGSSVTEKDRADRQLRIISDQAHASLRSHTDGVSSRAGQGTTRSLQLLGRSITVPADARGVTLQDTQPSRQLKVNRPAEAPRSMRLLRQRIGAPTEQVRMAPSEPVYRNTTRDELTKSGQLLRTMAR